MRAIAAIVIVSVAFVLHPLLITATVVITTAAWGYRWGRQFAFA